MPPWLLLPLGVSWIAVTNTVVFHFDNIGQRYDVIVTADQADVASNFWMRAIPQSACSENDSADDIKGIVTYDGATVTDPETSEWDYTDGCDDETANLVPYHSKTVGGSDLETLEDVGISVADSLFKWTLNSTSLLTDWANPTLMQVLNGETDYDDDDAIIQLDGANEWFYLVIETTLAVTHPIHLHGHDFFILAQEEGTYSADTVSLNLDNPPRRDVAMLPASGYLVLGWETDNPGVWLLHCHIGWHMSEGFALQFLERVDEIADTIGAISVDDTCSTWSTFQDSNGIVQEDSGI